MEQIITLVSLKDGAALEIFDREWEAVIKNINDVNSDIRKKREISIVITIEPYEDRTGADIEVKAGTTKLAGMKPVRQAVFFGKKDGRLVAVAHSIDTPSLFDEPTSTVTPIRQVGYAGPGGVA